MTGRIVHFEVPYDDGDRARDFYHSTFGWNITPMPELDYTAVTTGPVGEDGMPSEPGFVNGGMFRRSEGAPTSPVITIDVASIDDTLADVESAGGTRLAEKEKVGEMGWAAYFRDTEGNVVGLWQSA